MEWKLNLSSVENFFPGHKLIKLIGELDEFKGAWRSLSQIHPERLAALKKIATIESVGASTRIEGASLTDKEVEALLSGLKTSSFTTRDQQEVAGYAEAMDRIFENWKQIPFTENHIKQLHGTLLKYSTKDDHHRGSYKTVTNHVEAVDEHGHRIGIVFETASPFQTPYLMTELIQLTNTYLEKAEIHPLIIIAAFIVQFLAIHPFKDGNGRLSRCLTTLMLLRSGYSYVPFSSLESVIESNKEQYYLALRKTQKTLQEQDLEWQPWIEFFLRALQQQKTKLDDKIKREQILQEQLPSLSIRILELAREHGSLKSSDINKLTGESKSTIRLRLIELVDAGRLQRHGKGPATWYTYSEPRSTL